MGSGYAENRAAAAAALEQGKPGVVWRRLIADQETPVGAAAKLIVSGREGLNPGERIRVVGEDHSLAGASGTPGAAAEPLASRETKTQK